MLRQAAHLPVQLLPCFGTPNALKMCYSMLNRVNEAAVAEESSGLEGALMPSSQVCATR